MPPGPPDPPGAPRETGPGDPVAGVLDAVRAGRLLETDAVVAMVSGGRDSVCLLDVAVTLLGPERVQVLHVDYGLRPEAAADADHVLALGEALGVEVIVARAHRPGAGVGNVQAWARDVRYARATTLAERSGALVATGHTATDQVETVLYRLAASPGRRALLGMPAAQGRLVRPLLGVTREQTGAYCTARGLRWREDSSNRSDLYARARLRKGLARALREIHPGAEANVLRTVSLLTAEAQVLDELVAGVLDGRRKIPVARLAELAPALARLVAVRLAEDAAGRPAPSAGRRLDELLELGRGGGSAALDLGDGVRAIVEYGVLRFSGSGEEPIPAAVALAMPGRVRFGRWEVRCEPAGSRAVPTPSAPVAGPGQSPLLDADALGPGLLVRPWKAGDRMAPAGLRGTRTLADLFTDRRLPRARRRTVPVIEARGEVAWVPGIATAEAFRATDETRRPVRLSALRLPPDGEPDARATGEGTT